MGNGRNYLCKTHNILNKNNNNNFFLIHPYSLVHARNKVCTSYHISHVGIKILKRLKHII